MKECGGSLCYELLKIRDGWLMALELGYRKVELECVLLMCGGAWKIERKIDHAMATF